MTPIGLSLGSLYKLSQTKISENSIDFMMRIGCDALEIGCYNIKEMRYVMTLDAEKCSHFRHLSLHAPSTGFSYDNGIQTRGLMKKLTQANEHLNLDLICIHPDLVEKWDEINGYKELPLAVENMDHVKKFGRTIDELNTLPLDGWGIVLDLLHCYFLDPSMQLARDMLDEFGDKIREFHISGGRDGRHIPLFRTGQNEIMIPEAAEHGAPFILEGILTSYDDARKELDYVRELVREYL